MRAYRLYRLKSGHIVSATTFECDSEERAIALAEDALDGAEGELWCGPRLVKQIAAG